MHIQTYFQKHFFAYIKQSYRMLLIIILIDLIPLFGVLFWGWGTMDAVYLHFFETLILCVITYFKLRRSEQLIVLLKNQKILNMDSEGSEQQAMVLLKKGTKWSFRLVRRLFAFVFLVVNIPLCLLLLMLMLTLQGKGFSLSAVFGYNGGHTDLFVMNVNTFYIMITLLIGEHFYNYYKNYIKGNEYESSGIINETLAFEIRVIIQSIVMIGGVALMYFYDFSKVMIIILIITKTLIDVLIYIRNRYWPNVIEWARNNPKITLIK
ncbi:MAG: DUF6498-containing protein [Saprospiraceae bacterium]